MLGDFSQRRSVQNVNSRHQQQMFYDGSSMMTSTPINKVSRIEHYAVFLKFFPFFFVVALGQDRHRFHFHECDIGLKQCKTKVHGFTECLKFFSVLL